MIVRVVENKKKEEIVRGKGVLFGPDIRWIQSRL